MRRKLNEARARYSVECATIRIEYENSDKTAAKAARAANAREARSARVLDAGAREWLDILNAETKWPFESFSLTEREERELVRACEIDTRYAVSRHVSSESNEEFWRVTKKDFGGLPILGPGLVLDDPSKGPDQFSTKVGYD